MTELPIDLKRDGRALASVVIDVSGKHSRSLYTAEHACALFVREFLVLCYVGCSMLSQKDSAGATVVKAIGEEFNRFDPTFFNLLKSRLNAYFAALSKVRSPEEVNAALVSVLANYVDNTRDCRELASGMFAEVIATFYSIIAPDDEPANRTM